MTIKEYINKEVKRNVQIIIESFSVEMMKKLFIWTTAQNLKPEFIPKLNEKYWIIDARNKQFVILSVKFEENQGDYERLETGIVFKSKANAEKLLNKYIKTNG